MEYQMKIKTAAENKKNMQIVMDEWNLGPVKTSVDMSGNKEYWDKMAKVWKVPTEAARSQMCANCEYYDNTSKMMMKMTAIPNEKFDMDGGGRGYCHKFDFICHNLRTCQAWEEKSFYCEEGDRVEGKMGGMDDSSFMTVMRKGK